MNIALFDFYKCIIDSQEFGSDNEHVISRVYFKVTINGKTKYFHADIKQPFGSSFSYENDPLEVSNPFIGNIPINYGMFREKTENYFRKCVGSNANGINISGNSTNIRIKDCVNNTIYRVAIETVKDNPAW